MIRKQEICCTGQHNLNDVGAFTAAVAAVQLVQLVLLWFYFSSFFFIWIYAHIFRIQLILSDAHSLCARLK